MALSVILELMRKWKVVDPRFHRDVISAIESGCSFSIAANAAGITGKELATIRSWDKPPWDAFSRDILRAKALSQLTATQRRRTLAEAEGASMHETHEYLKYVNPEDFGPPPPAPSAPGALPPGGIQINIVKDFSALAAPEAPVLEAEWESDE